MTAVAILAGGTGGHVQPALALAGELERRGVALHWFGRRKGLEAELAGHTRAVYHGIGAAGLRGLAWYRAAINFWVLAFSLLHCCWILLRVRPKPAAAIGFGGYVSLPPACACLLLRIPLVLHEQNARTGSVNRHLSRGAVLLFCGLPGAFDRPGAELVGNPVRAEIRQLGAEQRDGKRKTARLLIFGGSQGAEALNVLGPQLAAALAEGPQPWQIHHLCGEQKDRDRVGTLRDQYREAGTKARVEDYNPDMAALYRWADLALCRAGAMTLAELSAAGLPALLVPLPNAIDDHQAINARLWQSAGAGQVVPQAELEAADLARRLTEMHRRLPQLSRAARQLAPRDAAAAMADRILQLVEKAA